MKTQPLSKRRGRPRLDAPALSRERIVSAAERLLAAGAGDVSMRAVASALGVNVMALYHHFSNKEALRHALVEQAFAPLFAIRPRLAKLATPELRLQLLAKKYLLCAAKAVPLTQHLAVKGGTPLATTFTELFADALGNHASAAGHTVLCDVLVDYLNGAALAGPKHAAKALDAGWPVLMDGVRRHLERNTETKEKTNE